MLGTHTEQSIVGLYFTQNTEERYRFTRVQYRRGLFSTEASQEFSRPDFESRACEVRGKDMFFANDVDLRAHVPAWHEGSE